MPVQGAKRFSLGVTTQKNRIALTAKKQLNMTLKVSFPLLYILAFLLAAKAQERAPHGLAYENPVTFSPSAVEFFHPKTQQPSTKNPCTESSGCSPLPLAAEVEATQVQGSEEGGSGLGAGGIAGIVIGLAFAMLLAMGGFYVFMKRRANANRENCVQPDA